MANFIAIDLDSQGLYAVAGAARGAAKVTHALAWAADAGDGDAPPPLTPDTAKAVGEQLRDKLRAAGFAPAPVLVTVGRDRVILKELKYPPVPPADEPALVRFQAMKEMSESPEDVVLDYAPLDDGGGGERRSMAVVVRKDLFNAIQAMCQAAGLKLAGVTPRPYAAAAGLTRALAAGAVPPPEDKADAVGALTLGPAGGEFTVVRRGDVTFTLAIPAPVVASETMLVAQLRRNLAVYAGQHRDHPVSGVYLAEANDEAADRLRDSLSVPVYSFDPLAGAAPQIEEELRGRFAGAAGLLAGRAADRLPINFAQPRQPQATKDPAKKRLVLIGVLAVVLIGGGLVAGNHLVGRQEEQVAELADRKDELQRQIEANKPNVARLKAIDDWSDRGVNWLDEVYELAERMPNDDSVHISSLKATPITPNPKAKTRESQALLELQVDATRQDRATDLMYAFIQDNPAPNKYYVGTAISTFGANKASAANPKHLYPATIKTKVNQREPAEYTMKNTRFTPPKRTTGGTSTSSAAPSAGPAVAVAPMPTDKGEAE